MYLLQDGRKISKKKTSTKRDDTNPIFNEAMIFSVPSLVLQVTLQSGTVTQTLPEWGNYSCTGIQIKKKKKDKIKLKNNIINKNYINKIDKATQKDTIVSKQVMNNGVVKADYGFHGDYLDCVL